jgi:hypothetical protein
VLAHESGEWEAADGICDDLDMDREMVAASELAAQPWARQVTSGA